MKERNCICELCGKIFNLNIILNGKIKYLHGSRKRCFECSPLAAKGKTNNRTSKTLLLESTGLRECTKCKEIKALLEFNDYKGRRYSRCNTCEKTRSLKSKRNFKIAAVNYKGGQCINCGYSKCLAALEFHHTDPTQKDYDIKTATNFEASKIELDKCILVCANCHREIHND